MNLQKQLSLFITNIQQFEHPINDLDPTWQVVFEHPVGQWQYWTVTQYKQSFTIQSKIEEVGAIRWNSATDIIIWNAFYNAHSIEQADEELQKEWTEILQAGNLWMDLVLKDWINTNQKVLQELPLIFRKGIISKQIVYHYLPTLFQWYDALEKRTIQKFLELTSGGKFENKSKGVFKHFSANKYFEYCKVIYTSIAKLDDSLNTALSGKEMYGRYADGRHEGLLDIDTNSEQEFADWFNEKHPKRRKGGHPWEIRGGRIGLYVMRSEYNKETFKIVLTGNYNSNLRELILSYNALSEAQLPVQLSHLGKIRTMVCLQDNFGILPIFESTMEVEDAFKEEDQVFDGIYYEDLDEYQETLASFIQWQHPPLLIPKNI